MLHYLRQTVPTNVFPSTTGYLYHKTLLMSLVASYPATVAVCHRNMLNVYRIVCQAGVSLLYTCLE